MRLGAHEGHEHHGPLLALEPVDRGGEEVRRELLQQVPLRRVPRKLPRGGGTARYSYLGFRTPAWEM